jgi:hypothetical protein
MPERVQRKRMKGWRMPPNTVSVTRPGKWGNPYDVDKYGHEEAIEKYREGILGQDLLFKRGKELARVGKDLSELRGKNLACYCRLDQPCHADVLLELANK